ncbi:MAG: hypothetical protein HYT62_01195 [Candidatus Yanofskybacteria bacterium]|nr:hypothetical protein [Candidatus Yanofskybacteria bacterium]
MACDILRGVYDALSRWANELSPAVFWALVRLTVILLLAITACFISQRKLYGQIPDGALITVQAFITLLAFLIGKDLHYDTIARAFGFSGIEQIHRDNRIHQYRNRLRCELLGELANRIFKKGKNRTYHANDQGWSFCWVRECENLNRSLLVQGFVGDPVENQ